MKTLILIRHAKSSWSSGASDDKNRPLNARGVLAAAKIGTWLGGKGYLPDEVISSSATRCAETWENINRALNASPALRFENALYHASPEVMLTTLQSATGSTVMMLGHMPGIGEFARDLRRDPPPMHASFSKYPTAATTVLTFKIENWADLQMGTGKTIDYVEPKSLP